MMALIAGQGALPTYVAAALSHPPIVAALDGTPPDSLVPDLTFRLETLGSFLHTLADRGVDEVCFAGSMRRPPIDMARIDTATAPLVPKISAALQAGDNGAVRAVIDIFEAAGFAVRGVEEVVRDLLPPRRGSDRAVTYGALLQRCGTRIHPSANPVPRGYWSGVRGRGRPYSGH